MQDGGHNFNLSGSLEKPAWLPNAFEHISYLVAPPKTKRQLADEKRDREGNAAKDDEMIRVDMTPWYYVRALLVISVIGWCVQLVGLIVEITMNERALVTAPGNPPWSRTGQWYGWEHGATTSKHYAHMMPMRGHFFYTDGWGPQGQQEIWSTISFGYHREADAWWSEAHGPEPRTGIAGDGPNTWSPLRLIYQRQPPRSPPIEDLSGSLAKT